METKIPTIDCLDKAQLDQFSLKDLKHLCRLYGLDHHGTKIALCEKIQTRLKSIESTDGLTLNSTNLTKIKNIYDLVRVLKIDNLEEVYELDTYEIEFLFMEFRRANPNLEKHVQHLLSIYPNSSDNDIKSLAIIDELSKMLCSCVREKSEKYGRARAERLCKRSVLRNRDIYSYQFNCENGAQVLLPKFGSRKVLYRD